MVRIDRIVPSGRRVRRRAIVVLALTFAAAPVIPASGASERPCRYSLRAMGVDANGWRHTTVPLFDDGSPITDVALDPWRGFERDPGTPDVQQLHIWATDGSTVVRNFGGGCERWQEELGTSRGICLPLPSNSAGVHGVPTRDNTGTMRFDGIRIGHDGVRGTPYVSVFGSYVETTPAGVEYSCPIFAFSQISRQRDEVTFTFNTNIGTSGRIFDVAVSRAAAHCVWALTGPAASTATASGRDLYRSTDHGATWSLMARSVAVDSLIDDPHGGAVGAGDCSAVWGRGSSGVVRSRDGGSTFAMVFGSDAIATATVTQYYTAMTGTLLPTRRDLDVVTADGLWHTLDGDASESLLPERARRRVPGEVVSATVVDLVGRPGALVVGTRNDGIFEYVPAWGRWRDVSPATGSANMVMANHLGAEGRPATNFIGAYSSTEVLLRDPTRLDPEGGARSTYADVAGLGRHYLDGQNVSDPLGDIWLTPSRADFTLSPGENVTVPFRFRLPRKTSMVDVDFEIDTTLSMDPAIDALRHEIDGIVDRLRDSRLDPQVGLGDIKDYNNSGVDVYRRRAKVMPPGPAFVTALRELRAESGRETSACCAEAVTVGMTQAVTGDGVFRVGGGVASDQDAEFRRGALKVMVLITDNKFGTGAGYPSIAQAISTLRKAGVIAVGIAAVTNTGDWTEAVEDIRKVAAGTGGLAPAGGADCDGDGVPDITAGAPLLCVFKGGPTSESFGNAIVELVLGARGRSEAGFALRGDTEIVRDATGTGTRLIDRLTPQELRLDATFACQAHDVGRHFVVGIDGLISAAPVASATVTVACVAPGARRPLRPGIIGEIVVEPPPGPPGPPAPQPPQPQPNTNVQANANPQANPHAVSGFVGQEQDEPSLATATDDVRTRESAGLLMMSALSMATAAGALKARSRHRSAPAFSGDGRRKGSGR